MTATPLLDAAWQRGRDYLGCELAIMGGAMSWVSEHRLVAALSNAGVDLSCLDYRAAFGRPLDYYTGLVFEISGDAASRPLAGGGRYDRLLTLLGAKAPIPGVGFSVWLDRIEAARR